MELRYFVEADAPGEEAVLCMPRCLVVLPHLGTSSKPAMPTQPIPSCDNQNTSQHCQNISGGQSSSQLRTTEMNKESSVTEHDRFWGATFRSHLSL